MVEGKVRASNSKARNASQGSHRSGAIAKKKVEEPAGRSISKETYKLKHERATSRGENKDSTKNVEVKEMEKKAKSMEKEMSGKKPRRSSSLVPRESKDSLAEKNHKISEYSSRGQALKEWQKGNSQYK